MVEKYITGTLMDDPEWLTELIYFLIKTEDKEIVYKHRKLFTNLYFNCIRKGFLPKDALSKAREITLEFKENTIDDGFSPTSEIYVTPNLMQIIIDNLWQHCDEHSKEHNKKKK